MLNTNLHALALVVHSHEDDHLHDMVDRFATGIQEAGLTATKPSLGLANTGYMMVSYITQTADQPADLLPALAINLSDLTGEGSSLSLTARKRPLPFLNTPSEKMFLLNPHQSAPEEWFLLDRDNASVHARRVFLLPTGPAAMLGEGESAIQAQQGWYAAVSFEYGNDGWDDITVDLRIRENEGMAPDACPAEQDFTEWVLSMWTESHVTPDDIHTYPWNFTATASAAIGAVI